MAMQFEGEETKDVSPSIFSDQLLRDPFPMFAQMRQGGAVVPAPFPAAGGQKTWLVTRMQEAVQVLKDSQRFTVDFSVIRDNALGQSMQSPNEFATLGRSMINVDGLNHRRLRGLVSGVFTPRYIAGLRPAIQRIADLLLDRVIERGSMDLVDEYAYPLPINVISDMLGIPQEYWNLVREGSRAIVSGGPIELGSGPVGERAKKIHEFDEYVARLVAEKRRQPQKDLISQLIQVEEQGERLSEPELLAMVGLLIVAGHETTSNLIGTGMLTLFDHPEQLAMLKADLSLVPKAVEELLRYSGPVLTPLPRLVTEDCELGGQHIARGDVVITVLVSANRDESYFAHADELAVLRQIDRHLAFGYGIHVCLGAPLARLEGDIAFTTLLRRLPNIRLAIPRESVTWHGAINVRGLTSLPVTF